MQGEILCEVGNADSYVAVIWVYVSQVIHDTTPDDNEEELDNQKESWRESCSVSKSSEYFLLAKFVHILYGLCLANTLPHSQSLPHP